MIDFDPAFKSKYFAAFSDTIQDRFFLAKQFFFNLPYAFEMTECVTSGDVSQLAPSELKKSILEDLKGTWLQTQQILFQQLPLHLENISQKIALLAKNAFQEIIKRLGYIIGPSAGLLSAVVIRLSMGKRAPTAAPIYFTVFMATTVIVTVWVVQFLKNPKYQKIAKDRGYTEALTEALPLPKSKIIEPVHARHFLKTERIDALLHNPLKFECDSVSEAEAKSNLAIFKQYCDWVKKKIKIEHANADTVSILKKTVNQNLIQTLKALVLFGDRVLIEDFLGFCSKDAFLHAIMTREDFGKFYYDFGSRLSYLLGKKELVALFPKLAPEDFVLPIMDAIMAADAEKVLDLTAESEIDPYKIFIYGDKDDLLLNHFNFRLDPINLVQASILSGNVECLKRLVASAVQECDWYQTDSKGQSLLALAALSGKKGMWDFVKQFYSNTTDPKSTEYLHLLYAAIKGGCLKIFEELFQVFLSESYKDICGSLYLDLYEKSISYGCNDCTSYLEQFSELEKQLEPKSAIQALLHASIIGGNEGLFQKYYESWKEQAREQAMALKDAYEAVLLSSHPRDSIMQELIKFENSFDEAYQKLDLQVSTKALSQSLRYLSQDSIRFVIERLTEQQLIKIMTERGSFFNQAMTMPRVLDAILTSCKDSKYLLPACAKEAIKLSKLDTLKMLCQKGLDTVKKLPDTNESLLSYSILSFNPDLINLVLASSPALSQKLITELKNRVEQLRCHREDEAAYGKIIRMLEAKSLERTPASRDDAQYHLALVKAGAMEFVVDSSLILRDDASRGLISAGLNFLGII